MKTYVCKKINEEIIIDGNFNKPVWDKIEGVHLVQTLAGETPKQETIAKLAWSDNNLYIAFWCEDSFINATLTEYNDALYNEEVVEVFIDDDCDLKTYIELEVNPLNALFHNVIHNALKGSKISFARTDKVVETAVNRQDALGFWSVEIKMPLSELVTAPNTPPKAGDKWLLNLYRIDRPKNGDDEYQAWSPTERMNYHTPAKFGELIFED